MAQQNAPPRPAADAPEPTGRVIAAFPRKNRQGPETELRISIEEYLGNPFIGIRVWEKDARNGAWYPTKKGCSIRIGEADAVADALAEAAKVADAMRAPNPNRGAGRRPYADVSAGRPGGDGSLYDRDR